MLRWYCESVEEHQNDDQPIKRHRFDGQPALPAAESVPAAPAPTAGRRGNVIIKYNTPMWLTLPTIYNIPGYIKWKWFLKNWIFTKVLLKKIQMKAKHLQMYNIEHWLCCDKLCVSRLTHILTWTLTLKFFDWKKEEFVRVYKCRL